MNPRRLRGLMRKEALQIVRDPSAIAIAFVMPVVLLFIFGYGVSLDAHKVPLAVVVEQPTTQTASLIGGFEQSPYFRVEFAASLAAARARLQRRRVNGIVWLRADFSRKLLAGRAPTINVIVSGTDANNARILESYVQGVWQTWLTGRARARGVALVLPVQLDSRVWFNPALRSRDFLVPGLIAIIMTLIGALLTALVVSREWERGTMEALFATPATMSEILLGKLIPYFLLGMGGMTLSVLMARWLFAVPLVGSPLLLFAVAAVFMLAALGMGLLISTVARNQYVAAQVAVVVTFLPAFMLSGFIYDIGSMPVPIQWLTHLFAARYFVTLLQTLFLAGDIPAVIVGNLLALLLMAAVFLGLTWRLSRKRLD